MKRKRFWRWAGGLVLLCIVLLGSVILICALCAKDSVEGDGYRIYEEDGVSYISGESRWVSHPSLGNQTCMYPSVEMLQKSVLSGKANMDTLLRPSDDEPIVKKRDL